MSNQNADNHVRYYVPHHFIFYPLMLLLIIFSARCAWLAREDRTAWIVITIGLGMIAWLSFMVRQHYALTLQNRLVVLEMRLRYYQITGKRLEAMEKQLGFSRLAALRFCDDEQLPALLDRTLGEDLSCGTIKKLIKNWQPDHRRV